MRRIVLLASVLAFSGVATSALADQCAKVGMDLKPLSKSGMKHYTFEVRTNTQPGSDADDEAIILGEAEIFLRFPDGRTDTQRIKPVVVANHGRFSKYCNFFIYQSSAEVVGATVRDVECLDYVPTYGEFCD